MLTTCLLEPISLSHHVCDLAESRGFLGGKRESGKDSRVVSNGLSARTGATAMPNQTCVTLREPRLLPCVNRAAGIPLTRGSWPTASGEATFSAKLCLALTYR